MWSIAVFVWFQILAKKFVKNTPRKNVCDQNNTQSSVSSIPCCPQAQHNTAIDIHIEIGSSNSGWNLNLQCLNVMIAILNCLCKLSMNFLKIKLHKVLELSPFFTMKHHFRRMIFRPITGGISIMDLPDCAQSLAEQMSWCQILYAKKWAGFDIIDVSSRLVQTTTGTTSFSWKQVKEVEAWFTNYLKEFEGNGFKS